MNPKKATSTIAELVSMADIFNDPIYLNMKGRRKLATSLGGILSAALILFLLSQGILQSVSMFNREDPQVYQISELEDDPTAIFLNNTNNFVFAIAISEYSNFVNMSVNSPFSFTITFNQYIRFTNGTRNKYKNKINLAPCTADQFPPEIYGESAFTSYGLNYAYCPLNIDYTNSGVCPPEILAQYPNCKTPPSFKISGSYLSIEFDFIQFNLVACNPSDTKLPTKFKCTKENITTLLKTREYKVNLFYANSVTNPMFYQTPNKTYIETIHWDLNPLISKVADIFVDKEIAQDYDSYWSTTSYRNRSYYSIQPDKMRELQVFQTTAGLAYLQWNIRRSSVNIVTTRTYAKIQDVMTDLGGFSKAVMFIAAFIAIGYVEYKYQLTLSNEFYDFQMSENKDKKKKKSPKKEARSKPEKAYQVEKDNFNGEHQKEPTILKKDEDQVDQAAKAVQDYFEQQREKRKGINFGLLKYFKMVVRWLSCRRNEEDEVAEKARNLVQEELDIIRVIQKLKEIDKLKVLLLNRYQREVFNFIEKPLVTLESDKPIHLDSMMPNLSFELDDSADEDENPLNIAKLNAREEYDSLSKYAKLYMAYRYLLEDKHIGNEKYNKKLLDMIGDDLIEVFKKVDRVMDENPDPRKFDDTIKKIFEYAEEFNKQE